MPDNTEKSSKYQAICEMTSGNAGSLSLLAKRIEEVTGVHFTECGIRLNEDKLWVTTWSYFKISRFSEKEECCIRENQLFTQKMEKN